MCPNATPEGQKIGLVKALSLSANISLMLYSHISIIKDILKTPNTFDNVKGQFPIGFFIWNLDKIERFSYFKADIFNQNNGTLNCSNYEIDIDPSVDIHKTKIPNMILQPLIENSIIHGFKELSKDGFIQISFKREGKFLRITIEDNGSGLKAGVNTNIKRKDKTKSIAVQNIKDRITTRAKLPILAPERHFWYNSWRLKNIQTNHLTNEHRTHILHLERILFHTIHSIL